MDGVLARHEDAPAVSAADAPRRLMGRIYRTLAGPLGARALEKMLRDGLPARLGPPLRFLFTGRALPETEEVAARIEKRRAELAGRPDTYRFLYSPSSVGTVRWLEPAALSSARPLLSSRRLASAASVPRRWGMFLHLCAEAFDARGILEIGACFGISGAYLASIRSRPRFVTLEGSAALAPIAEATLAAVSSRAVALHGPFERGISRALALLADENLTVDIAYIDGHHEEAATVHYVRTFVPYLSREALIVLDDIRLTAGMWQAWQRLASLPGVAAAVNVGRFGLLVWNGGDAVAAQYDLARYTGWWPVRRARRAAF